jgi:hypothetical protein
MNSNINRPENTIDHRDFINSMTREQARFYVKREVFILNLAAQKSNGVVIDISSDNWRYFDQYGKFVAQQLGTEVIYILTVKKGQNETLFYLEDDHRTYKAGESIIKQLISQLLGNKYNQNFERDTLAFLKSYLPEEKIKTSNIPKLTPLSEVISEEVSWLWEPYLALGKIAIVEGDPGLGKTFFALAVATSISNGWPLIDKDGTPNQAVNQGKVLYLTAEDGLGDTLRPRLEKMGANVANIIALEGKITSGKDDMVPVSLLDVEVLREALNKVRPTLIIIDPIQAYLGPGVNMSRAEEVRPLLSMLGKLAEEFKSAVIIIRHLTKAAKDKASYRGMGSIDFTAAARSVLLVGKDPDDDSKRVVVQTKSSLSEQGKSISFTITEGKFEWLGQVDITAAEILAPEKLESDDEGEEKKIPFLEARKYLIDSLKDGPKLAKDLCEGIAGSGFSKRTLEAAKIALKIKAFREGGKWLWAFPPDAKIDTP